LSVVDWEQRFLASVTLAAEDHKTTHEGEGEQNQNEESNQKVDHSVRESTIVVITGDESRQ
jgi:hypothetical protein